MKKFLLLFFIMVLAYSCTKVPITGRSRLALIPNSQLLPLSFSSYNEVLKSSKLSTNAAQTSMVKSVGRNVAGAIERYMREHNLAKELSGYNWEFNLIEENTVNAWCMPGGKVAFYTGIMPICKDENGIAVVMGHEIAHAVAEHGNERMTQGIAQQLGGVALAIALQSKPQETQALFMNAYGLGTTVGVMLPFSRLHESEADKMGLIFMAMAGYDPHEAPEFWKRMAAQDKGSAPPEFLSTHPASSKRIKNLTKQIPEAMKYYKK